MFWIGIAFCIFLIIWIPIVSKKKKKADAEAAVKKAEAKQKAAEKAAWMAEHFEDIDFEDWIFSPKKIKAALIEEIENYAVVDFEQEPENSYDNRAVKVLCGDDNEMIGYLYRGRTQDIVNEALDNNWEVVASIDDTDDPDEDPKKWIHISGYVQKPKK